MATAKKKSSSKRSYTAKRTQTRKKSAKRTKQDYALIRDIKIILAVFVSVFLFICNFGLIGKFGDAISGVLFGLFGIMNYVFALFVAGLYIYKEMNAGDPLVTKKTISLSVLFFAFCCAFELINGAARTLEKYDIGTLYRLSATAKKGGGVIAGSVTYGLISLIDVLGTIIVLLAIFLVCVVLLTERSFFEGVKERTEIIKERSSEDKVLRQELYNDRKEELQRRREEKILKQREKIERERQEREKREAELLEKSRLKAEQRENDAILRKNRKFVGVTSNTDLLNTVYVPDASEPGVNTRNSDIHEITVNDFDPLNLTFSDTPVEQYEETVINASQNSFSTFEPVASEPEYVEPVKINTYIEKETVKPATESVSAVKRPVARAPKNTSGFDENNNVIISGDSNDYSSYQLPPLELLSKGKPESGDSKQEIRDTAYKLQETLAIFGVEATVTDISQGPTVTRFELQPKLGVKVSRIKNLSDDIKLNLAASEIRIEAPIPGKAAIGIEVPNKKTQPVLLRDLLESPEFKNFNSDLAFAVGKDITGKTIVYNIGSFPHLLIAGATGAGKSVCINTMIMSILYKANPDDVKLIMIDPKVVELSVYNGIPHLMLPVVTDIKKAAATLNFAVNEMHERFNKFAEYGVRDIEGYLHALEERGELEEKKMPHLVIIVDEVADLMLSERKNVEDAIQSLTQLARAAGIHLIIATQRPSVDVITGVIKANMPSRIAFAVSSNTDSRTILDMGGAEELLGKGDMLFFPKGLKKPVRLQGGFVSDKEVNDICEFVRKQGTPSYDASIEEKIKSLEKRSDNGGASSLGGSDDGGDGNDSFFRDAGFFIIDNNKASIGMLQRKFKMGFNRAARIMDQLADAGVVGPDEGTKPRQILMSHEQFENYLEEYGG